MLLIILVVLLCFIIPPLPGGGEVYTVLPLSVCPSFRPSVRPSFRPSVRPSVRPRYFLSHFSPQLSRQTGIRNLTGPNTLPTLWHTYMKLVAKYQISANDSC